MEILISAFNQAIVEDEQENFEFSYDDTNHLGRDLFMYSQYYLSLFLDRWIDKGNDLSIYFD